MNPLPLYNITTTVAHVFKVDEYATQITTHLLAIPRKRGRSRSDLDPRDVVGDLPLPRFSRRAYVTGRRVASQEALQRPLTVWGSNGLNWYASRQTDPAQGRSPYILKCIRFVNRTGCSVMSNVR